MAGLLVDKLYNPSAVVITDMESHMSHINHNIELNAGQYVRMLFYRSESLISSNIGELSERSVMLTFFLSLSSFSKIPNIATTT